jgi:hypothetical protein
VQPILLPRGYSTQTATTGAPPEQLVRNGQRPLAADVGHELGEGDAGGLVVLGADSAAEGADEDEPPATKRLWVSRIILRQAAAASGRAKQACGVATIGWQLPVSLTVYDAPAGNALGDVEAGRAYAVVAQAHSGAWMQLDVEGSGLVWAEAAAWGEHAIVRPAVLPDVTP